MICEAQSWARARSRFQISANTQLTSSVSVDAVLAHSRRRHELNEAFMLALQLQQPAFEVSLLCGGLMSAPPSRPSTDEGWLNAPLRQSDRDAPDLLHRPGNLQAWR